MPIENAMVASARPAMLQAKVQAIIEAEGAKGCLPGISPVPVALEPPFRPISTYRGYTPDAAEPLATAELPSAAEDLLRLGVWISPDQGFDWNRCELFLKQLAYLRHRMGFEIVGNQERIVIDLVCHRSDGPVIETAFNGVFAQCRLVGPCPDLLCGLPPDAWSNVAFVDYYPLPPYSHLLTRPSELRASPYESLIVGMNGLPAPAVGIYQALFQPVRPGHNWHANVNALIDLEYNMRLLASGHSPSHFAQQPPSAALNQMAREVEDKAHNDKPFFAAALRIAVAGPGDAKKTLLRALSTFTSLFQHGGRPLSQLSEAEYLGLMPADRIREMFASCVTYRPGFLVNSWELAGPVHIPPARITEGRTTSLALLETLSAGPGELSDGTPIGTCNIAGCQTPVRIPADCRNRHTGLIGGTGTGKTTVLESMISSDITDGAGVAVVEPHGDLTDRLLGLIPEDKIDKVIYLDFSNPDWVPIWNPLQPVPGQDLGRVADDLLSALKSVVTGWGDRLEHLLRHTLYALLHLPGSSLLDVSNLLRGRANENDVLRRHILQQVDNEAARQFWLHDFQSYGKDEFAPPRHKLSKLLVSRTVSLMLSQPNSSFNLRKAMDDGMILLVNLSDIGHEIGTVLGSLFLSLLHLAALSRSDTPVDQRKPFHVYCDEAHRFVPGALENMIAETRKYGVSLTLAHQSLKQLNKEDTGPMLDVGSVIIFRVNKQDAAQLTNYLQGLVKVGDLTGLEKYKAVLRCEKNVVRFDTAKPLEIREPNFRQQIIEESHRRYYKPAAEVRQAIRDQAARWGHEVRRAPAAVLPHASPSKEYVHDTF